MHEVQLAGVKEERETFHGLILPTAEEKQTLRRVAGKMPASCYYLCAVEFAERASYYGCNQVYKNFIRAPLPPDGPGTGAAGSINSKYGAGALGKGSATASAMTEAFKFLSYALPIFFGWLADTKYGRFKMICWGVAICGVAHSKFPSQSTYYLDWQYFAASRLPAVTTLQLLSHSSYRCNRRLTRFYN